HFKRLHEALQAGVEVKRRVVENLRPSLLDNLGLFPALRWQVADSCGRAGLHCTERYPPEELDLTPEASIAIFRIVQEALTNIVKHAQARNVEVSIESRHQSLIVRVQDDGIGLPLEPRQAPGPHGLAAMRHRALGLGGQWHALRAMGGGTEIEVRLPLEKILATESILNSTQGTTAAAGYESPHARSLAKPRSSEGRRKWSRDLSRNASTPNNSASCRYSGRPKLVRTTTFGRCPARASERSTPKPEPVRRCRSSITTSGCEPAMLPSAPASVSKVSIRSTSGRRRISSASRAASNDESS